MSRIAELLTDAPPASAWSRHARAYWPYLLALIAGMMLIIYIPELSPFLPRSAGLVR
jgi:TRAP-type C4-dicarboxylate transport system permease large subunit